VRYALAALAAALLATAARAESPRWGSFELQVGRYFPDIDSEFSATTTKPYEDAFGAHGGWMFRAGVSKSLFTSFGSLEAGVQSGYFQKSGKGRFVKNNAESSDDTALKIIPMSVTLTYRFDMLAERFRIPLAPYARVGIERYAWWVTDGSGSKVIKGATNGWSVAGGLALLLDVFDPGLAREMDADSGVNHTYLFAEARKTTIDDFGSSSSWDLSEKNVAYSGGLLFVF